MQFILNELLEGVMFVTGPSQQHSTVNAVLLSVFFHWVLTSCMLCKLIIARHSCWITAEDIGHPIPPLDCCVLEGRMHDY